MEIFHASPEQSVMIDVLSKATQKFVETPALRKSGRAIDEARILVEEATKLGIPDQAYMALVIWIGLFDEGATLGE